MQKWFRNIADYWRFIANRRKDASQPVFPRNLTAWGALILILAPLFTLVFVDPVYVEQILRGETPPDPIWQTITDLGKSDWILYPTGIALIGLSLMSADRFRKAHQIVWHRIYLNVHYLFTTVALSGLAVQALKALFARARPEYLTGPGVWESKHLAFVYDYTSFPSGHSTTAGAAAMALTLMFPRLGWFFIPAGMLIALSRNAVYAHFPSDSCAGFLFGMLFSYFYARYFARKRLLFAFAGTGKLRLRGEGNAHMALFTPIKGWLRR